MMTMRPARSRTAAGVAAATVAAAVATTLGATPASAALTVLPKTVPLATSAGTLAGCTITSKGYVEAATDTVRQSGLLTCDHAWDHATIKLRVDVVLADGTRVWSTLQGGTVGPVPEGTYRAALEGGICGYSSVWDGRPGVTYRVVLSAYAGVRAAPGEKTAYGRAESRTSLTC